MKHSGITPFCVILDETYLLLEKLVIVEKKVFIFLALKYQKYSIILQLFCRNSIRLGVPSFN